MGDFAFPPPAIVRTFFEVVIAGLIAGSLHTEA